MKLRFFLILAPLALTDCAVSVKRTGYSKPQGPIPACEVVIAKEEQVLGDRSLKELGFVSVEEAGMSVNCSEAEVLQIVREEACSQGANLALISSENRPDVWSTCYRVKASLMAAPPESVSRYESARYAPEAIEHRSRVDFTRQAMVIGAVVFGVILAPLLLVY